MARIYNATSISLLDTLQKGKENDINKLHSLVMPQKPYKEFYNLAYRLIQQDLVNRSGEKLSITADGEKLLGRLKPERDGMWKMVIFDIPEKHQKVRTVLRAKLRQLHFKKWQNSIWVSPYILDKEIEDELNQLGDKFFIRLIKFTQIDHQQDLDEMFKS